MATVITQDPPPPPSRVAEILRRTSPWVRLMSILLYLTSGLMILGGLAAGLGLAAGMSSLGPENRGELAAIPALMVGILYACIGSINLIPATFLMRFANRAKEYAAAGQTELLERALDAQRSYWKFMGILAIVGMTLALLVIPVAVIAGLMAMRQMR